MSFDEELGNRIRMILYSIKRITERNMFVGLTFIIDGKMFCGVIKDKLVVRVGPENNEAALSKPHTSQMNFAGKSMIGYIFVEKEGLVQKNELNYWINLSLSFTRSLPSTKKSKWMNKR